MGGPPDWMDEASAPPPWRCDEGRLEFENPWLEVHGYEAVAPTGRPARYHVVRFRNLAVGVLPIHADGTVTLVGQQRFPLRNFTWEMPEGGVPFDEAPLAGAQRELREETGLNAAEWREVLWLETSNSVTDERAVCFIATGLTEGPCAPDETEDLRLARVPFRALLDQAVAGGVQDAMTVAATLRAYHMAREGELPDELVRAMLG